MKVKAVVDFLENIFPLKKQEEWDNSGFLVKGEAETGKILVSLTLTKDVIQKANSLDSKLIICHHPHFLKGESKEMSELDVIKIKELNSLLEKNKINFYAIHTNYDKILMNKYLLNKLNLNIVVTEDLEMGAIGHLNKALELRGLIEILKDKFSLGCIMISNIDLNRNVKKVGICGGSGKDFIDFFIEKADILITGDLNYHSYEKGVYFDFPLIDIGHYKSEILGFQGVYDLLYGRYREDVLYFKDRNFHLNY